MRKTLGQLALPLLAAVLLLSLGLVGCGSEPAPAPRPPAPPPQPPPFQPQPVEVKSESGATVATLMTAEGGGYTLNGEPFDGGEVESDGKSYELALVEGSWVAVFLPESVEVTLGGSDDTITLETAEAGGWTLHGEAFEAGSLVTEDGRKYDVQMVDGAWTATFQPQPLEVPLGRSDDSITLEMAEAGGWTLDGEAFEAGPFVTGDGRMYDVQMVDGAWKATFQPESVDVMLGRSGDTITLETREAGGWSWEGEPFDVGDREINGRPYRFTMTDGQWRALYTGNVVTAMLGQFGGTVELSQAEDGTWWIDNRRVASPAIYKAANGNRYRLVIDDEGGWTGVFVPVPESIANIPFVAKSREDGSGFDVEGAEASLDMTGSGEFTVGRHTYRVSRDSNGRLAGAIADSLATAAYRYPVAVEGQGFSLSGNGESILVNHADDDARPDIEVPLSDLVPDGYAEINGQSIVDAVRDYVAAKLDDFKAWVELANAENASRTYNREKEAIWREVNAELANRLDLEDTDGGRDILGSLDISAVETERREDERDSIEALENAVAALSSKAAFAAALEEGGIFGDNQAYGASMASEIYSAGTTLTQMTYRAHHTLDLRFGAWRHGTRAKAHEALGSIESGAYAYSANMSPTRWVDMPLSGRATFEGLTSGIDTEGELVDGRFTMTANFANRTVEAVLRNLIERESRETWHDGDGYVRLIKLPFAEIKRNGLTSTSPAIFEGRTAASAGFSTGPGGRFRTNYATVEYQALSTPIPDHDQCRRDTPRVR